jgi:hypothetical protein
VSLLGYTTRLNHHTSDTLVAREDLKVRCVILPPACVDTLEVSHLLHLDELHEGSDDDDGVIRLYYPDVLHRVPQFHIKW